MDKVLEALYNCIRTPKCLDCPWESCEESDCEKVEIPRNLACDVYALLKAQQPRVMTLEEVKASKGDDMYLEISALTDEIPYITAATLDGVGTKGVVFYCSHFDFVAYNRRLYGWRCWTSRPDEKTRSETPWDGTKTG